MRPPIIAYVGMTHLGICSSIAAASKGFNTICYTSDLQFLENIKSGTVPIVEPGLTELLEQNRTLLNFTSNEKDIEKADVIYVSPDVTTNDSGESDLSLLNRLLDLVFANARIESTIIILSQVPPGFTRSKQKNDRKLFYQVETLIFGRAVERATRPERLIIGCNDPSIPFPKPFNKFLKSFKCPILPMRFESAELAKISINFCLVSSISVANTLAELSENIGADWMEIVPSLKLDRRIGEYSYLTPGLGISGGNLERDLATVLKLANKNKVDTSVVTAWIENSRHRKDWASKTIIKEILTKNSNAKIAVLGLAYKENTHSTKNSAAIFCVNNLSNYNVSVFDPVVDPVIVPFAKPAKSINECIEGSDALLLLTPWPQFSSINIKTLVKLMKGRLILDPYRMLEGDEATRNGFDYITLGCPPKRAYA